MKQFFYNKENLVVYFSKSRVFQEAFAYLLRKYGHLSKFSRYLGK